MNSAGALALSTMYHQRFEVADDPLPFFEAGRQMGFRRFELSHILSRRFVDAVDPSSVDIAAVHHPCPSAPEDGAGLSLCASDGAAGAHALKRLEESIETGARLKAQALVLHLGQLEGNAREHCRKLEFELDARFRAGQSDTSAFELAGQSLRDTLAEVEGPYLERALGLLSQALPVAAARGLQVGIETGYSALELPTAQGMEWLLDRLDRRGFGATAGAWLDTGHVAARSAIGLDGFDAYFEAVGRRWIGVHLHDCVGRRDHLAPGAGTIDFSSLRNQLPAGIVQTCELDWYLGVDEIEQGCEYLLGVGFGSG